MVIFDLAQDARQLPLCSIIFFADLNDLSVKKMKKTGIQKNTANLWQDMLHWCMSMCSSPVLYVLNRIVWHVASIAGDAFKRRSAAVSMKTCICFLLAVCAHICLSCVALCCVALCWRPVGGLAGVVRAFLRWSFIRAFESVRLVFLLSAPHCSNQWPFPPVSLKPGCIVVGLCVSVAKQQLAHRHTKLCHAWAAKARSLVTPT